MESRHVVWLLPLLACSTSPQSNTPSASPAPASTGRTRDWPVDSASAAALACDVVRQLRRNPRSTGCRVESFREEPKGFMIGVRESAPDRRPLDFPRSRVWFPRDSASVTVSRIPEQ